MEFTKTEEKKIGLYFRLSVLGKGLVSALEILGGLIALFVPLTFFSNVLLSFTQGELIEDQSDFIATHLSQLALQFAIANVTFIAFYLLSRGIIKLLLVVALLKNQLWAYPSSLVVLGLFVAYQLYQIALTQSALVIALTIFDLIVMWFIWREWEVVRA